MSYIFNRSSASVQPDYAAATKAGATVALNAEDPDLPNQIARARQNGQNPAIWIPAGDAGEDPKAYAQRMAGIVKQYGPSAILPNIEYVGQQGTGTAKGAEGASWSKAMMDEFARYYPPGSTKLDVVVEGSKPQNPQTGEGLFDYKPYLPYGDVVVESFWGDMRARDPAQMRQILIDSGVPPDKINMLLAPGQQDYQGGGKTSAYTLDDMKPGELATFLANYQKNIKTPVAGGAQPGTRSLQSTATGASVGQLPNLTHQQALNAAAAANRAATKVTPSRLDQWSNPAAQAQARRQLAANQLTPGKGIDAVQMLQDYRTVQDRNLAALAPARAAAGWDYDVRTAPAPPTPRGTTARVPGGAFTQVSGPAARANILPQVAARQAAPAATPRYTATAPRPVVKKPPPRPARR